MHFSDGVLEVNGDAEEQVDAPVVDTCDPVSFVIFLKPDNNLKVWKLILYLRKHWNGLHGHST